MTFKGTVKGGMIVVDPPVALPDGTAVEVTVASAPIPIEPQQSLHDVLKPLVGIVDDMPEDSSLNIDHYLYGHSKK
jgi:hypothetical protein